MNFTKQSLKAAVIKVFEDKCNLDNYEFATLVDMFEAFRELKAEHAELQYLCSQRRFGLEGILSFLTAAQHIAPEQAPGTGGGADGAAEQHSTRAAAGSRNRRTHAGRAGRAAGRLPQIVKQKG